MSEESEGLSWSALFWTIVVAILILIPIYFLIGVPFLNERNKMNQYESFCNERPTFCYCDFNSCEYKTSYINGVPSKDTKDLCDLATKLKDKEMIFKSCNG